MNKKLAAVLYLMLGITAAGAVAETRVVPSIAITPNLDVSYFSPYIVTANITDGPVSAHTHIYGMNGDGGDAWDFLAHGAPHNEDRIVDMTYDAAAGVWKNRVFPDHFYPEIFFAPSSVTWNNAPEESGIRKSQYHLLHIMNPFRMKADMSFFVEINARAVADNSTDLDVFLVKNNTDISFFNDDWRRSDSVEHIGSLDRRDVHDHTHVPGISEHHLIPLSANADGTVGSKHLDVSGDFWLILVANTPKEDRGWSLLFQSPAICQNTNGWFAGSQSDWSTTPLEGCPDTHFHVARRGTGGDAVKVVVNTDYADGHSTESTRIFTFEPLPNLAPNGTSFTAPAEGETVGTDTLRVAWDAALDPNNDSLLYRVFLEANGILTPVSASTSALAFDWTLGEIADGEYALVGIVCDNASPALCVEFRNHRLLVMRGEPVYALTSVSVASDNASSSEAVAGDTVTLTFTATGDIADSLTAEFYTGGRLVTGSTTLEKAPDSNTWTAQFIVSEDDVPGTVDFIISGAHLDLDYQETTDGSFVVVSTSGDDGDDGEGEGTGETGGGTTGGGTSGGGEPSGGTAGGGGSYTAPTASVSSGTASDATTTAADTLEATTTPAVEETPTRFHLFMKNLRANMTDPDVLRLQRYLNEHGYPLAGSGPGSPGLETEKFGRLTYRSVVRLQEDTHGIATGFFGPITRMLINVCEMHPEGLGCPQPTGGR